MNIGNAVSIGLIGLKAFTIKLQAFISGSMPNFSIIGLPDTALSEARERVKSAHLALHCKWPEGRVTVNLSPASMPKSGASYDLAIAASILSAEHYIPLSELENTVILGELNLDGTVLPIQGMLPIALYAKKQHVKRMIIPQENLAEAQLVDGIESIGIHHILDLITQLHGKLQEESLKLIEADPAYQHMQIRERSEDSAQDGEFSAELSDQISSPLQIDSAHEIGDMSEVIGQEHTKWALQVAAAGGHHVMMIGPPGSGKTMLASRIPSIMCPLNEQEQLEVASIRSLCGTLPYYGISDIPPFEAPHHTASAASLIGGGTGIAKPGIITVSYTHLTLPTN